MITPEARRDIKRLQNGIPRVDVALDALRESRLSGDQVKKLAALLKTVSPTEGAASATKSEPVAVLKEVDGYRAVVDKITVNGQQLDTLLSEGSFNKTLERQRYYARQLGGRIATREENLAYVKRLLAREKDLSINLAEFEALDIYRRRDVRDNTGCALTVPRYNVLPIPWGEFALAEVGALFVRASAKSK